MSSSRIEATRFDLFRRVVLGMPHDLTFLRETKQFMFDLHAIGIEKVGCVGHEDPFFP
jgi:hypothetical protein